MQERVLKIMFFQIFVCAIAYRSWMVESAEFIRLPLPAECTSAEFKCHNGQIIDCRGHCQGSLDCEDGSDETVEECANKKCSKTEFRCSYGACIPIHAACNGRIDCADGSDETLRLCNKTVCEKDEFRCSYGGCTHNFWMCDGTKNCADGSDETRQLCAKRVCDKHKFRCNYGACIYEHQRCNGRIDCADGSDETHQVCAKTVCDENKFRCKYGACIDEYDHCDGNKDCADGSDETAEACANKKCSKGQFRCKFGGCIDEFRVCDTEKDCADGSDEFIEICGKQLTKNSTCPKDHLQCKNGGCIESWLLCDGTKDCLDGSDETVETCSPKRGCPHHERFRCDYGACIESSLVCNGEKDCFDGSDETIQTCGNKWCGKTMYQCAYGACIAKSALCDGKTDCADGSDENPKACAANTCKADEYRCSYGGCIKYWKLCNGERDCADGSDEFPEYCDKRHCHQENEFRCHSGMCIERSRLCDGRVNCDDASDEIPKFCALPSRKLKCPRSMVQCSDFIDVAYCMDKKIACDGHIECSISDESAELCGNLTASCKSDQFACSLGLCIDNSLVCDGEVNCPNGKDETDELCKRKSCDHLTNEPCQIVTCDRNESDEEDAEDNGQKIADRGNVQIDVQESLSCWAVPCTHPEYKQCAYGPCIVASKICDGKLDCRDGSDEIPSVCAKKQCSINQFRCAYGGCINIRDNKVCNGKKDCIDGSDEDPHLCKNFTCSPQHFTCNYGACIDRRLMCNGLNDCLDGSDEAEELCQELTCGNDYFQCDNGACIWQQQVCNRIQNCKDGSDERPEACQKTSLEQPKRLENRHCVMPVDSLDKNITVDCPPDTKYCLSKSKRKVTKFSKIFVTCNTGYALQDGSNYSSICSADGTWSPTIRKCSKICDKLPTHLEYTCKEFYNGPDVPCHKALLAGAVVTPHCKPHHVPDSQYRDRYVICLNDGSWDREFLTCTPVCGKVDNSMYLIAYGTPAKSTPWNVALYRKGGSTAHLICGGTLLNPNLVITAAHCVYSELERKTLNESLFEVAVCKYTRDSQKIDNQWTQKSKIRKIFLPDNPKYTGLPRYQADLAILWLRTKIELGKQVLPACVHWTDSERFVPSENENTFGNLTGFGYTENDTEPSVLLAASLPYISIAECRQLYNDESKDDLAVDKFCAGYQTGSGARMGDSGAGLVFYNRRDDLYYLRGVVSSRQANSQSSVAAFTDIALYLHWIKGVRDEVESADFVESMSFRAPNTTTTSERNVDERQSKASAPTLRTNFHSVRAHVKNATNVRSPVVEKHKSTSVAT